MTWFCVNGISSPLMPSQNGKAEKGAHSVKQQLKEDPDSSSGTLQPFLSNRATRTCKISRWASEEIHQNLKYLQKLNYDTSLRWECEQRRSTSTLVNTCKQVTQLSMNRCTLWCAQGGGGTLWCFRAASQLNVQRWHRSFSQMGPAGGVL